MRRKRLSIWLRHVQEGQSGASLIAVGLALLLAAACLPLVPTVTAMACVALGATDVTLARFRGAPSIVPILVLHATTYGGLFALFVGAALDATAKTSTGTLNVPLALDLAASTLPAAAALRRIGTALRSHRTAG